MSERKSVCVVWDLDDTLYQRSVPFEEANQVFKDYYQRPEMIYPTYDCFKHYSNLTFDKNELGLYESIEDMWIERITLTMGDFDIRLSESEALFWQKSYSAAQKQMRLSQEIIACLNYLKEQVIIGGIITNGANEQQYQKIQALNLSRWFSKEQIVISGALGIAKPDSRIFEYFEELQKESFHFWYIGDSYVNDIEGAKKVGWRTIWLQADNAEKKDNMSDYTVKNASELLDVLVKIIEE